jgi:hypothetical protein
MRKLTHYEQGLKNERKQRRKEARIRLKITQQPFKFQSKLLHINDFLMNDEH